MDCIDQNESFSVLIPDGESVFALSVLQCLSKNKNVKKYVLSNSQWSPARFSRHSDKFIYYNDKSLSADEKVDFIFETVRKYRIDVLLPVDCKMINLLSENVHILSEITNVAIVPDIQSIKTASDKWLLGKWMVDNGVCCPDTILYSDNDDFDKKLSTLKFPVLIKPRNGSGGAGIEFFDNKEKLLLYLKSNNCSDKYVIQSFMNGYDIDCSVLCRDGKILAHTIQKGILYSKAKVSWPSGIDFFHDEETYQAVESMIAKLNWSGIVHIDLRYDTVSKKINVIEMNPRFWASVSASLFAGVNFPYIACTAALNKIISKPTLKNKRVVRSAAAFKIAAKRLVIKKNKDLYFNNSFLQFIVNDPLTFVMSESSKIFSKVFYKKN